MPKHDGDAEFLKWKYTSFGIDAFSLCNRIFRLAEGLAKQLDFVEGVADSDVDAIIGRE